MRNSFDHGLIFDASGLPCGFTLGADFCAEHEYGVREIKEQLGIMDASLADTDDAAAGIDRRRVTAFPEDLFFFKVFGRGKNRLAVLVFSDLWNLQRSGIAQATTVASAKKCLKTFGCSLTTESASKIETDMIERNQRFKAVDFEKDLERALNYRMTKAAWNARSFAVVSEDSAVVDFLGELYTGFSTLDVWQGWISRSGGKNPFERAGLSFSLVSRTPVTTAEALKRTDLESASLMREARGTGIYEKLKAAGRAYFALTPRLWDAGSTFPGSPRDADGRPIPLATQTLMFFLTPMDQRIYDRGWFTVEELEAWARGEGPVILDPKKA